MFTEFVRMDLAINAEESCAFAGISEVHFEAPLIEPGVSVGCTLNGYKRPRCFLIFIHFIFWPRGNCQLFHSDAPKPFVTAVL